MESDGWLLFLCIRHFRWEFQNLVGSDYCVVYAKR